MFFTYTYFIVFLGTFFIGITAGLIGVFVYFRRESLVGDVLGHAALPGIVLAFMLTFIKDNNLLILGATISGLLSFSMYRFLYHNTPLDRDAALGSTLAFFSGLGITLLTYVQKIPESSQAGLWDYIFGNASNLLNSDVYLIIGFFLVISLTISLFYKELKTITFDTNLAESLNLPVKKLDFLLTLIIGAAVMIGIKSIGIILMSSLIVAPATTVKLWSKRFSSTLIVSGAVGGLYCLIGTGISLYYFEIPVGPIIVMVASLGFLFSLLTKLMIKRIF